MATRIVSQPKGFAVGLPITSIPMLDMHPVVACIIHRDVGTPGMGGIGINGFHDALTIKGRQLSNIGPRGRAVVGQKQAAEKLGDHETSFPFIGWHGVRHRHGNEMVE